MDAPARTRLTAPQGRRFGATLGIGFGILGGLALWRGHQGVANALFVLAAALFLAALLIPTRLGPVERAWMALGVALSRVTAPAFYTLLYLLVITPMGFIRRIASRSPLARDAAARSYWVTRAPRPGGDTRGALERQF